MIDLAKKCESLEKEVAAQAIEIKALRAIIEARSRVRETGLEDARQAQIELGEIVAPAREPEDEPPGEPEEKAPSLKGKSKGKRRVALAEKLEGLPVGKVTNIIPEEVAANPDLYKEIGAEECVEVIYKRPHRPAQDRQEEVREEGRPREGAGCSQVSAALQQQLRFGQPGGRHRPGQVRLPWNSI